MDMKRLAIGTIVGAVTMHAAGYLLFQLALVDFYAMNVGSATGVERDVTLQWALAVGNIPLAALITYCIDSRSGAPTIAGGFVTGAVIGFVVWFHADFIMYGFTNVWNLTLTIVDPPLSAITRGIAGALIAAVLARVPKGSAARPAE